jgi:HEAT repeat protein
MSVFRAHTWPGNMEELHSVIKRLAVLTSATMISREDLDRLVPELEVAEAVGRAEPLNATQRRRVAMQTHALSDLSHEDPARRHDAIAVLERGTSAVNRQAVARLLEDPVPWVRTRAVDGLAAMGVSEATAYLMDRLPREDDPTVATRVVEVLAESGAASCLPTVKEQVRSPHIAVRRAALIALRRLGSPADIPMAAAAIADPAPEVRAEALGALAAWGQANASLQLMTMLSQGSSEEATAACGVIGELGIGTNELVAALSRPEPPVRAAAIRALGRSRRPEVAGILLQALNDPQVRSEAIRALGDLEVPAALPSLQQIAAGAESVFLRKAAIESIGAIGDRSAIPYLVPFLDDDSLAMAALDAIVTIGDPTAEEAIVSLLGRGDSALLEQAINAITILGTERSVRPLLDILPRVKNASEPVLEAITAIYQRSAARPTVLHAIRVSLEDEDKRLAGLQLLGDLGDPIAVPWLLPYRSWSEEASISLLKIGRPAVPALIQAAREQPVSRDDIRKLLTEMGPDIMPEVLPLLLDRNLTALAESVIRSFGEEAVPEVVAAVENARDPVLVARLVQLLGRTGNTQLAPYVAAFLDRPEPAVRYAALIALGDLADPRSESQLMSVLNSEDETAVALAVLSLGRLRSKAALAQFPALLASMPDWRQRYAIAAALSNYAPDGPEASSQLHELIHDGLPYTASAVSAKLIDQQQLLEILSDPAASLSRKLRALSLLTELPDDQAVPALAGLLGRPLDAGVRPAIVSALAERGAAAVETVATMLEQPAQQATGLAVLRELKPPAAVVAVLRRIAGTVQVDQQLRVALQDMGELLIGPLFDRIYEDWDLDTLTLLWSVAQVIHGETQDLPQTVRNFTVLQERFLG